MEPTAQRTPVFVRWRDRPKDRAWEEMAANTTIGAVLLLPRAIRGLRTSTAGWPEGRNAAIWPIDAPEGSRPLLVVRIETLPSKAGEGDGVVVGDIDAGEVTSIEVAGEVLRPTAEPAPPTRRRPRR